MNELVEKIFHSENRFQYELSDACILSAADSGFFGFYKLLYYSLDLSHELNFVLIDLGLKEIQRKWCESKSNLQVIRPYHLLMPDTQIAWQTWNKPIYFRLSPFSRNLWIDVDCVVYGSLAYLFSILSKRPVFTVCHHSGKCLYASNPGKCLNSSNFHSLMGTNLHPHQSGPPSINAGIVGLDKSRELDNRILSNWERGVQIAALNKKVRDSSAYFDQGILQWVLENENLLNDCIKEAKWNRPYHAQRSLEDLLTNIKKPGIYHFAGSKKFNVNPDLWPIDSTDATYRVFVIGHEKATLDTWNQVVADNPNYELVSLPHLDIPDPFITNKLAESRFFIEARKVDTDYVALITASWQTKFRLPLSLITDVISVITPSDVYVPAKTSKDWSKISNQSHPGMLALCKELAKYMGYKLEAESFYANNFICHREIYEDLLIQWRKMFDYLYDKYGFDLPFNVGRYGSSRKPAYLYERITMLYFANRPDLQIKDIKALNQTFNPPEIKLL